MRPVAACVLVASGLFLAPGCNKNSRLMPVDGTVTLDGEPVTGMIITFQPQGDTEGNGANGYVGDGGHFSLTDMRGEPGAYRGTYRISFYPALEKGAREDDPAGVVAPPRRTGMPAIYLDPGTSPITVTVPDGGASVEILLTKTGQGATAKVSPKLASQ
jgi:hypothetical protein